MALPPWSWPTQPADGWTAFFERGLNPWDFAAGVLLVEEAGGQVTDFSGNPVDITQAGDILASNGRIGGQIREAL